MSYEIPTPRNIRVDDLEELKKQIDTLRSSYQRATRLYDPRTRASEVVGILQGLVAKVAGRHPGISAVIGYYRAHFAVLQRVVLMTSTQKLAEESFKATHEVSSKLETGRREFVQRYGFAEDMIDEDKIRPRAADRISPFRSYYEYVEDPAMAQELGRLANERDRSTERTSAERGSPDPGGDRAAPEDWFRAYEHERAIRSRAAAAKIVSMATEVNAKYLLYIGTYLQLREHVEDVAEKLDQMGDVWGPMQAAAEQLRAISRGDRDSAVAMNRYAYSDDPMDSPHVQQAQRSVDAVQEVAGHWMRWVEMVDETPDGEDWFMQRY